MNPIFIIIIIAVTAFIWFLLSFIFFPVGKIITYCWEITKDRMNKNNQTEKEKEQ